MAEPEKDGGVGDAAVPDARENAEGAAADTAGAAPEEVKSPEPEADGLGDPSMEPLSPEDELLGDDHDLGDESSDGGKMDLKVEEVVQTCLRNGTLFEDPAFLASDESLFVNPFDYPPYVSSGVGVSSWRRPEQMSRNAVIFLENQPPGDVAEGDLGDAWFLGAAALVSMRPDLISFNFAHGDYARDAGVVVCRLFREGQWQEILIDTRFPFCDTLDVRRPTYGHCVAKEEVWMPLLEKAMAKALGCYEKLHNSGSIASALVDLTGGSVATYDLRTPQMKELISSNELWHFVKSWFVSGCVIGCECQDERLKEHGEGIAPNRAHGVLDVVEDAQSGLRLVRIRNPWSQSDWKGAFADHDAMWNKYPDLKEKLGYEFGFDGTWWMRFEDWCTAFTHVYVCRLFPEHWHQHQVTGMWHELTAAGQLSNRQGPCDPDPRWFNNPQVRITLETDKPTTVFFSLLQSEANSLQLANLIVLKAKGPRLWDCNKADVLGVACENTADSEPQREVTFEVVLKPQETGKQYICVCYQDVVKPDEKEACKFFLRVFASEAVKVEMVPSPHTLSFPGEWKVKDGDSAGGRRLKQGRLDNPAWGKNPQLLLAAKRTTNVKIVCERHLGRRRQQGVTVGFAVARMNSSSEPKSPTRRRKGTTGMDATARSGGSTLRDEEIADLAALKRKIQVLPSDWVQETSYTAEDFACMFVTLQPQQGPLCLIPSLSEEGVLGQFTLSVFSDRRLASAQMVDETRNAFLVGSWTAETAGGCHLYSPPFEQKSPSWARNPRFALRVKSRTRVHLTLSRIERPWRAQLAKDTVGCMLGLYICHGEVVRECVLAETTFVAGHEVSLEYTLDGTTPENPYLLVPCTYEPGKLGEFMLRVTSDDSFDVAEQKLAPK